MKKVEKLKLFAYLGFAITIFILGAFASLAPKYYWHYKNHGQIHITLFKCNAFALKAFGMSMFMFFNHFSIIPICNMIYNPSKNRLYKIIGSSCAIMLFLDTLIAVTGYFSEPDISTHAIFLLRKPIGENDLLIQVAKIGFGFTLFVGAMLKFCYLLLYLNQIVNGLAQFFFNISIDYATLYGFKGEKSKMIVIVHCIRNLSILTVLLTLTSILKNKIDFIISFTGSFIGLFETVLFPS